MDMSVVAVDPPPSLPWIGVFLAVWPIFAVYFGRRGAVIRLLMLLPISLSAAATGLALERVAQVLSLAGSGPHAVAAGLAEGVVPIAAGSVSALLTLAVVAYRKRASVFVTLHAPVLPLLGLTLFAEAVLGVYLWRSVARIFDVGFSRKRTGLLCCDGHLHHHSGVNWRCQP